ncbi:hypothetical protein ACT7DH_06640 [Bacillus pacificus]
MVGAIPVGEIELKKICERNLLRIRIRIYITGSIECEQGGLQGC